ncbi:MAG: integrase [Deltaproteobacteria bacterium GWC2_55_46]|nr:MAG: integrase [Deltaproteobacteria bacterium GWC2_55_46]
MPNERLSMRKIREILRLKWELKLRNRQVSRSCAVSHNTVREYVFRATQAGLSWPLPAEMDDGALERLLFPAPVKVAAEDRNMPAMEYLRKELGRKHVTLMLLWQEYKEGNPEGYQYSQFCEIYRRWTGKLDVVLRQEHRAGEKLFVDYAGSTIPVVDRMTGEITKAELFVAVLGASNYTYAEATSSQSLHNWISSHIRAFEYFGGATDIVVPDNLKSGVTKACRYEPDLNPTYHEMAVHYGTTVMPARAGKPRDKAKVEAGVLIAERWILAALRNRTFFSISDVNEAICELLERLNGRKFKKLDTCRRDLFETLDKPVLKPLPAERYEYAEWKRSRVNIDYHIEVDAHYYSVPYQLIHKEVEVRLNPSTVEVIFGGRRVASHQRSYKKGGFTTTTEHRPKSHQKHLEWTPSRIIRWAESIGPCTAEVVKTIMESKPHPEQGYRSCLGILRLGKRYSEARLEAACQRALTFKTCSYRSMDSILKTGLDKQMPMMAEDKKKTVPAPVHQNIRGGNYYH